MHCDGDFLMRLYPPPAPVPATPPRPAARWLARAWLLLALVVASTAAGAQGFSALVSPPRFEASAKPGSVYRNVLEVTNVSDASNRYHFKTADWTLESNGDAAFSEALSPGSCRPWVGLETAEIALGARAKRRYRFEVAVPADAPVGECRFAILIEGDAEQVDGNVPVPIAGRIAVIVYLAVGEASARLEIASQQVTSVDGRPLPVLTVRNVGNAHGRLEGLVDGTDADGRRYAFAPSGLPILAGETRRVVLTPEADEGATTLPTIRYPLLIKGRLEAGSQRIDIDATVAQ